MSSTDGAPEDNVETSDAGGLGELVPESLMPVWRRIEAIQAFRETHSNTYIAILEVITAIVLTVGYLWWIYLFILGGSGGPI